MKNGPLSGMRVLLVEDDFYLAEDATTAVREAGGEVVGPFGNPGEALEALSCNGVDIAVLDINLGNGPAFELARELRSSEMPFVFATGYDEGVLPEDLRTVTRLQKPFRPRDLVDCLSSARERLANPGERC